MFLHETSFVLFLLFKQKTAYEMRISDWSSDVCSSDLREPEMAARVGEIAVPTLILFGDEDRVINPSAAKTFNERIAGSEVVMLPGIGHLPMEEALDATAAAIAAFLTRRLLQSEERREGRVIVHSSRFRCSPNHSIIK